MKIMLKKHEIETFHSSNMMSILIDMFKEIAHKDAEELSRTIGIKRTCEEIALQVAEFKGRQQMLHMFTDPELLIQFLDEYIIVEEDNQNG